MFDSQPSCMIKKFLQILVDEVDSCVTDSWNQTQINTVLKFEKSFETNFHFKWSSSEMWSKILEKYDTWEIFRTKS